MSIMISIKVKLQKKNVGKNYYNYFISIPADLLDNFPKLKKKKYVRFETDLIGNLIVRF